jgi:hypothetical protein
MKRKKIIILYLDVIIVKNHIYWLYLYKLVIVVVVVVTIATICCRARKELWSGSKWFVLQIATGCESNNVGRVKTTLLNQKHEKITNSGPIPGPGAKEVFILE